jgi:hypothetical protein
MYRLKQLLDRSVAAQAVLVFVLAAGVTRLISPHRPVAVWLFNSAFYTAMGVVFVIVRRRRDRAVMGGATAGEHASAERKMIHGQVPDEPQERDVMRRLVRHRRRQMGKFGWTMIPLLALLVVLCPVFWAATGAWTTAVLWLVFGAVFGSWMVWIRRLNLRRLAYMDEALSADRTPAASARR